MSDDGSPMWRRGRLLIASPSLVDPNFHRCVVLMLEHSANGALGVVLNRPMQIEARVALPGALADLVPAGENVHEGGPVQPEAVIMVADFTDASHAATLAFSSVGVVDPRADTEVLAEVVRSVRVFGGYAGWATGQLEDEIDEGAWIDGEGTVTDVFTDEPDTLWSEVLDRKGGNYRFIARMPEDPTLN
jgi:putative transcriptional regulator